MKLISRVPAVQVKRAFVAAQLARRKGNKKLYLPMLSRKDFSRKFNKAKVRAKKMTDAELDRFIGKEFIPRRNAYRSVRWYVGIVNINEAGVWKGAGGLPLAWTRGSLGSTAKYVRQALKRNSKLLKKRARRSIPRILSTSVDAVQSDKYLLPIVLPPGTIKSCRRGMQKLKGDIDDGCMRSIALAVSGKKSIKAYIGVVA